MKRLFYILLFILCILVVIYFFKEYDDVLNMEYREDNIVIEYPCFNNDFVDNIVSLYLNDKISSFKYRDMDRLFIDYDYKLEDNDLNLKLYYYELKNNKLSDEELDMNINMDNEKIVYSSRFDDDLDYDIVMNKIIDKNKPMIALTFDDGPNHNTLKIIDILKKYGVRATFFVLGINISGNEKIIEILNDSGMEIGNHMYSHKLLTRMKENQIREEYDTTRKLIYDIIGRYPYLNRPSYGSSNKKIRTVIDGPIIGWNIDTLDWKYHNSNYISNKILDKVSDGSIILMHDIYSATANALDKVVPQLLDRGYQIVTVSELFYYKDIELKNKKVYRYAK